MINMGRNIEKKQVLKDDVENNKNLNIGLNLSVEQQDKIYNYIYGIGEEYLKILNTNFIERVGIFCFTAISTYLIIIFTNIGIRKGLKEHFEAEEKQLPKLPNNSISIIVAIILGLVAQYYLAGQILSVINMGFFGKKDSIFHMDYSYFIMAIPVIQTILKMILVFLAILSLYIVRILYNSY